MNAYRVKEIMWAVIVLVFLLLIMLSGCSSAPRVASRDQYCHTSQTIETTNRSEVNSKTVVECTDDRIKQLVQVRTGIANNCGENVEWIRTPSGKDIPVKTLVCQKFNGRWEIVPEYAVSR
jgi:uncharacterized protein YceK